MEPSRGGLTCCPCGRPATAGWRPARLRARARRLGAPLASAARRAPPREWAAAARLLVGLTPAPRPPRARPGGGDGEVLKAIRPRGGPASEWDEARPAPAPGPGSPPVRIPSARPPGPGGGRAPRAAPLPRGESGGTREGGGGAAAATFPRRTRGRSEGAPGRSPGPLRAGGSPAAGGWRDSGDGAPGGGVGGVPGRPLRSGRRAAQAQPSLQVWGPQEIHESWWGGQVPRRLWQVKVGRGLAAGWEGMYLALGGGNGSVGAWIPVCVCLGLVGVETGIVGRGLLEFCG